MILYTLSASGETLTSPLKGLSIAAIRKMIVPRKKESNPPSTSWAMNLISNIHTIAMLIMAPTITTYHITAGMPVVTELSTRLAGLQEHVELAEGLGVVDLFAPRLGLELKELLLERNDPDPAAFGTMPSALKRPGVLDDIPAVIAKQPAEVLPVRIWKGLDVLIKCVQGDRLPGDIASNLAEILIRRHGDEPEQKSIKHAEAGEDVADDVVRAGKGGYEQSENRPHQEAAAPEKEHERARNDESELPDSECRRSSRTCRSPRRMVCPP